MSNVITYDRLVQLLKYDPETGLFTWRKYRNQFVPAGSVAGSFCTKGYLQIKINNKNHSAHRLAWLYVYGYLPENQIDHINRIKDDNRIVNLREVSASCNMRNRGMLKSNTSGVVGVSWNKKRNKWTAHIMVNRRALYLGAYNDKDDAVQVRWKAEVKYGFPNCCSDSSAYQYLQEHKITLDI